MLDHLVFIGRFAPLHNGHVHVIKEAMTKAKKVHVLVGSANSARNPRNPFTFAERRDTIVNTFLDDFVTKVEVYPINDYPYNDNKWIAEVQSTIAFATGNSNSVGLIGYSKDHTSYYLKMFPQWKSVNVDAQYSTLNSSDIRREYFKDFYRIPDEAHCPKPVVEFLTRFTKTEEFKWLVEANKFNVSYNPRKYDNDIVACVDAVVVQSGHVLLIRRKDHPGKGLLALPGGHVDKREKFLDACIRELKEETHIADSKGEIPPAMLKSFITKKDFFDDPHRSLRARVTSMAYLFELPNRTELFDVRGDDDAERLTKKDMWHPLGSLKPTDFHDDHYHIIQTMLGK